MTGGRALVIPVGLDFYAAPMESVQEVVTAPGLCHVPTGPATVLGLFNLRGQIVPLFDTAALLGVGHLSAWPFAAVVWTALGPAGLAASGIPESMVLGEPIGPAESHGTVALYTLGRRLVALMDVEVLLTPATVGGHVGVAPGGTGD